MMFGKGVRTAATVLTWVIADVFVMDIRCAAAAPSVMLIWNPNLESDIVGYKVYYGTNSRVYTEMVDVGLATSWITSTLASGATYYFAVTAYNTWALESDYSEEVSYTVPEIVPPPGVTGVLSSSANPALPGTEVIFTFTISAAGLSGIPTGPVIFRIDGSATTVPLVDAVAVLSTSTLSVGTHVVEVEYPGDLNFGGVTNRLRPDQLINTPPLAGADAIFRILPAGAKVQLATLLQNDVDADGHPLTLISVDSTGGSGATLTRRGSWIYYVPPEGFANSDTFTYAISDGHGQPTTGTVNVRIADAGPAPNVTVSETGESYRVRFDGTPGLTYRIEYAEGVEPINWQSLGIRTADQFGLFEIIDTPPPESPSRSYRSVVAN
jgi:hypothetical protein